MKKYCGTCSWLILPALFLFSCAQKKAANIGSAKNYPISQLTDSVKTQFSSLVNSSYAANDSGMVAMAVYLQQGDQVLVDTNYFFSNNNQPLPNDSTVFQMGSVTKTFTAALIARQVNLGKMDLNAPAQNYLPAGPTVPKIPGNFNGQTVSITLGNLASMNAGLVRNAPVQASTKTTPYLFAFNFLDKGHPLVYKPGSDCYIYSNLGFGILGLAACLQAYPRAADYYNNYEKVVVDSLLNPLAMHDTRITLNAAQQNRRAIPYSANGTRDSYNNPNWPFNYAAGGLYSTLRDMRLYAKEMAGQGNYLTKRDIDTLLKARAYVIPDTCKGTGGHYAAQQAMAWVLNSDMKDGNGSVFERFSKDGGLAGFSTFITFSTPTINAVPYKAWVVLWANKKEFPVQPNAHKLMQLVYNLLK